MSDHCAERRLLPLTGTGVPGGHVRCRGKGLASVRAVHVRDIVRMYARAADGHSAGRLLGHAT